MAEIVRPSFWDAPQGADPNLEIPGLVLRTIRNDVSLLTFPFSEDVNDRTAITEAWFPRAALPAALPYALSCDPGLHGRIPASGIAGPKPELA